MKQHNTTIQQLKIGIFFGGRSREREISFAGGRTVYDNLDKSLFEAVPIFVDSFGHFVLLEWHYIYKGSIRDFYPPAQSIPPSDFQVYAEHLGELSPVEQNELTQSIGQRILPTDLKHHIDFAFLALHGAYAEDGSIQGMLQYLDIPYTASGILPSAMGMDKVFQKKMMQGGDFNVPSYQVLDRSWWLGSDKTTRTSFFENLKKVVKLPCVIKAANQGSSIGASILTRDEFEDFEEKVNAAFFIKKITKKQWSLFSKGDQMDFIQNLSDIRGGIGLPLKVRNFKKNIFHPDDLLQFLVDHFKGSKEAVQLEAFDQENEVLIEAFLEGKEFSVIVLRDERGEVIALPPTEIRKGKEIFDYRSKYLAGLSSKITPIQLPDDDIEAIRRECEQLFCYFKFNTYARIDGFIQDDGTIYLNDPNTTSGMLPSSFFFHQAAEIGLNPSQFLTFIIRTSLQERRDTTTNSWLYSRLLTDLDRNMDVLKSKKTKKTRVAVILGGYSSERHISVESGRNIYEKLASSDTYLPIPIFLTGDRNAFELWQIPINILLKDNADDIKEKIDHFKIHPLIEKIKKECRSISEKFAGEEIIDAPRRVRVSQLSKLVDFVFIALHGRPGEDGRLQRDLEKYHLPYNGSGIASSQMTIDKFRTNQFLKKNGLNVARQFMVYRDSWLADSKFLLRQIEKDFSYPLIAKPSDDGCSSAVKLIRSRKDLMAYMTLIFRKDEAVLLPEPVATLRLKPREEFPAKDYFLVEEYIDKGESTHFLEVTGGLLTHFKNGDLEYEIFEPSETLAGDDVLSLEEKFLAGQGQNITPARYDANAVLSQQISKKIKADLQKVAEILDIEGYARIDLFVKIYKDENGTLTDVQTYIIELNSLPGMTPATAIFHQCALNDYTPYQFIHQIIEFGKTRFLANSKQISDG